MTERNDRHTNPCTHVSGHTRIRCTRSTAHDENDADVAVILCGVPGHFIKTKMAMYDIACDILLDTGIRIQPLPVWEGEWAHPGRYPNFNLLRNIARKGIVL